MEDNRQEDLDLLFVFRSIKKGISNVLGSIVSLFYFSIKNFWVITLFTLIFSLLGAGLYLLKKPYYFSSLSVSHIRFENDYCREMVQGLNSCINESNNNISLAEKLSLNANDAMKIRTIKYEPLSDRVAKLYADSVAAMLPFKVEVEVYSNDILDTLQDKIIKYLEANEYATTRKQFEEQSLNKIEARLDKEIKSLDSLKRLVEKSVIPQSTGSGIILGEPINPVVVYEAAIKLYEKKLEINEKQSLNNSFSLMVGFSESNKVVGPGKLFFIAVGALVGCLAGLCFSARRSRKIK